MELQKLSIDEASLLSRQLVVLYASQERTQWFGEWIFETFFPEMVVELLDNGRDFFHARRTADARTYLLGMLTSGRLPAAPLQEAIAREPAASSSMLALAW